MVEIKDENFKDMVPFMPSQKSSWIMGSRIQENPDLSEFTRYDSSSHKIQNRQGPYWYKNC